MHTSSRCPKCRTLLGCYPYERHGCPYCNDGRLSGPGADIIQLAKACAVLMAFMAGVSVLFHLVVFALQLVP